MSSDVWGEDGGASPVGAGVDHGEKIVRDRARLRVSITVLGALVMSLGLSAPVDASVPAASSAYTVSARHTERASTAELLSRAKKLAFDMSLASFMSVKRARKTGVDKDLVWTDDGCSAPSNPYNDDFLDPCLRHDFSFRNFGSVKRLSPVEPTRLKINEQFHSDMRAVCSRKSNAAKRAACRGAAAAFFKVVNDLKHGATAFHDEACDAGYFCMYDDDDQKGWRVQFESAATNLKQFANGDLNDNVKSVYNRTSSSWRVYANPDYEGDSACAGSGDKSDFDGVDGVNDEISSLRPRSDCRGTRDVNAPPTLGAAQISLAYPSARSVTFSVSAADDSGVVSALRVKTTGESAWRPWVDFVPSGTVVLPDSYGEFRVSFQVMDGEGALSTVAVSNPVTRRPDTAAPSITGVSLSHGDPASQFVAFTLSAVDDVEVTQMRAIVNGEPRPWNGFATSGTVVLPDGYGNFGIGFEVSDSSGNVSATSFAGTVTRRAAVSLALVQVDNNGNVRSCGGSESNPCSDVVKKFRTTISSAYSPPADLLMKAWRKINGAWVESSRSPFERSPIDGRTVITQTFTDRLIAGVWRFQTQVPITVATQFAGSEYTYLRIS